MTVNQIAMKKLADYAVLARVAAENIPSPCISVCRMDTRTGVCEGCLRTIYEIRLWSVNSDSEKRAVWGLIAQRIVTATVTCTAP
jgi:predicted Fe-S protein YdhL (DUF1289 family)